MVPLQIFHDQAPGAIPNGTLIEKCNHEDGDSWPNGTLGTVLASLDVSSLELQNPSKFVYYIDFVADPGIPVMIMGNRIKPYEEDED